MLAACRRTLQPVTFLAICKAWPSRVSRSVCHISQHREGVSEEGKHAHELLLARKTGRKRTRATSPLTTSWRNKALGRFLILPCPEMSLFEHPLFRVYRCVLLAVERPGRAYMCPRPQIAGHLTPPPAPFSSSGTVLLMGLRSSAAV